MNLLSLHVILIYITLQLSVLLKEICEYQLLKEIAWVICNSFLQYFKYSPNKPKEIKQMQT